MKTTYLLSILLPLLVLGIINNPHNINAQVNNASKSVSDQITVTAFVPLSDLWEKTLKSESKVGSESRIKINNKEVIWARIIGIDDEAMKKEDVKAEIRLNDTIIHTQEMRTDKEGSAKFAFVPKEPGEYEILFTITTYETDVVLDDKVSFNL